jgi:formate dehydrogenase (coenzyme F420) beta subunit
MEAIQSEVRRIARSLFEDGKIDLFIGYEAGTVAPRTRPVFITAKDAAGDPSATDRLVWGPTCTNNLAGFLQRYFENVPARRKKREEPYPRIGMVVKGCDMRSLVALTKERQAFRSSMVLVGVPCRGMLDLREIAARAEGREVRALREEGDRVVVVAADGSESSHAREELVQSACRDCRSPRPDGVDHLVAGDARTPGDGGEAWAAEIEALSAEERWRRFSAEMAKCIRCNACRQACPTCWCKECFAEHTDMKWIGVGTDPTDAMAFHIIRIYHQAGRCTQCDACVRACPMGVDLRPYTRKIAKDVRELFGYVTDFDAEAPPPLVTFKMEDDNSFITDPEEAHP